MQSSTSPSAIQFSQFPDPTRTHAGPTRDLFFMGFLLRPLHNHRDDRHLRALRAVTADAHSFVPIRGPQLFLRVPFLDPPSTPGINETPPIPPRPSAYNCIAGQELTDWS